MIKANTPRPDAAEDKTDKALSVEVTALAWSASRGAFNEKITASAKAELPPGKQHLTRITFMLYALSSGGRERIDTKDGHLKDGRAEVEFTLYYPQSRRGLPEQYEYTFTAKHRDSKEATSPALPVSCRESLTLKDIREILEAVERERNYEAARLLASSFDYDTLCSLAEQDGEDNDPNQMPTRFLLLPGMDDEKLEKADTHPAAKAGEAHTLNITNLRKALNALGHSCAPTGPFDGELLTAMKKYLGGRMAAPRAPKTYMVKKGDTLGKIAKEHGLPDWGILYEANKKQIGPSPHLLKEGIKLEIPNVDLQDGKRRIRARGPSAEKYFSASGFRYPWSLLSIDLGRIAAEAEQPFEIILSDRKTGAILWSGETRELRVLIPDSEDLNIGIKGYPLDIDGVRHIHPEDENPIPL
jgi:LysM repeat protein